MARGALGDLVMRLSADLSAYTASLNTAEKELRNFGTEIRDEVKKASKEFFSLSTAANAIGGALGDAISSSGRQLLELAKAGTALGDVLTNASERTGVSVESLGRLKFAAEQSDTTFEDLTASFSKLAIQTSKALVDPNGAQRAAFERLGVSVKELQSLDPESLFVEIADGVKTLNDPVERAGALNDIFGKSYAKLIPILSGGGDAIRELGQRAEDLNVVLGDSAAGESAALLDAWDELKTAGVGLGAAIADALMPFLRAFVALATEVVAITAKVVQSFGDARRAASGALTDLLVYVTSAEEGFDGFVQNAAGAAGATQDLRKATEELAKEDEEANKAKKAKADADKAAAAATRLAEQASRAAAAAEQSRRTGLKEANEFLKAQQAEQKRAEVTSRAFTRSIIDSIDPVSKLTKQYEENIDKVKQSVASDVEKSLALKVLERDYNAETFALKRRNEEAARQPLEKELESLRAITEARKQGVREAQIEIIVQQNLSGIRANSVEELERETEALRKKAEELIRAREEYQAIREPAGTLGEVLLRALEKTDFKGFFKSFSEEFSRALAENPLQLTADVLTAAAGFADLFKGTGSDIRRNITAEIGSLGIPVVSQIAQAATALDAIFGGRVFGTNWTTTATGIAATFGPSGALGSTLTFLERQRSLFRGRAFDTQTTAFDASQQNVLDEFFQSVRNGAATGAALLAVSVPELITGAFREVRDTDGNIKEQISQVGGRIFREGFEDFQNRVRAEAIIDVVRQSASEAGDIAEQWRGSAERLLDGAALLLRAQVDIRNGVGLLTNGGLGEVVELVTRLAKPGEALSATYDRLLTNSTFLRDALESVSLSAVNVTAKFVEFSDALVTQLGGLQNAQGVLERVFNEFFTPLERAEARSAAIARRVASTREAAESLIGSEIVLPIPVLVQRALSGVYSAEASAAILNYADAVTYSNSEARAAATAQEELTAANLAARQASLAALDELSASLTRTLADLSGSDFSRGFADIADSFNNARASISGLTDELGDATLGTEAYAAAQAIFNRQLADLQRATQERILRGLIDLYGELDNTADASAAWRVELEKLERESAALSVAGNLRDLFASLGQTTLEGFNQLKIPTREFLADLGLNVTNFSLNSGAALGRVARALGLTIDELVELGGGNVDALSPEQLAQAEAVLETRDTAQVQADTLQLIENNAVEAEKTRAQQAADMLQVSREANLYTQELLAAVRAQSTQLAELAEALARANTRAAVGV